MKNKDAILSYGTYDRGFPRFKAGDTIQVAQRIREGNKERLQYAEGDVIAIHNNGIASTFTLRRVGSHGIPVERVFPYYSPYIESIKFMREGDVRRAKLYYIRKRVGKAARVKEKVRSKQDKDRRRAR